MDFSKLSNGDKIALGGGLLLFVSSFFPFFGEGENVSGYGYIGYSTNGWDHALVWLGLIAALVGVVILALKSLGITDIKFGTIKAEQIALMLVALGTLLIVIQVLVGWHGVSRKWGIWVAIVIAAVTLYGTFMSMREKGIELPDADDFRSLGGGGGAPPPPPPPPA
jgi:hypothetical protein